NQIFATATEPQGIVPGTEFVQAALSKMGLRVNTHVDQKEVAQRADATGKSFSLGRFDWKRQKPRKRIQHLPQLANRGNALPGADVESSGAGEQAVAVTPGHQL